MRSDIRCRYRAGMFLLASVVCLFGCRQSGAKHPGLGLGRAAAPPPAIQEEDPLETITAEQKADVQMAVARSVEKQGYVEQAIRLYLEVLKKDGRRADAYHRLAVLHDKKGNCVASAEFYREALQRDPDNAEIHCDLGYSYYFQRRWKEAETSLHRALQLNPNLARAHNNLGLLLARTDRNDAAMVEFLRAGCNEAEARGNLAFVLTSQRRQHGAERPSVAQSTRNTF